MAQSRPLQANELQSRLDVLSEILRRIGELASSHMANPANQVASIDPNNAPASSKPDIALGVFARKMCLSRRNRARIGQAASLFQDPASDILLDVFIAQTQDKFISVTDASHAGKVPVTTALRWVWALEKRG